MQPVYQNNDSPFLSAQLSLKHHQQQDWFFLRHTHHTYKHTDAHTHKSPCLSSLSLSPRPPYLLALLHVADALSQSTLQFWGNIRCSEDRLRHNIKHGNVKVKQIEQHYYSANNCTSLPDSFVPACLPLSSVWTSQSNLSTNWNLILKTFVNDNLGQYHEQNLPTFKCTTIIFNWFPHIYIWKSLALCVWITSV